ncbi:MAG: HPr family phosphocarrier protein [Kurthia sp.]|nr:HPr family phosphocarrier protein [Candidatus Kurthia equi]
MQSIQFTVTAAEGIHARPATMLVSASAAFASTIKLIFNGNRSNLKSILAVMSLGIPADADVAIEINGADEDAAKEKLVSTIASLELGNIQ